MSDIEPTMAVVTQLLVGGTQVEVDLQARGQPYQLADGDALTVAAGDADPVALTADDVGGYSAALDTKASGTSIVIGFARAGGETAPSSTVTMTEQLAINAPAEGGTFSRASDDVKLTWISDPSRDPLVVSWSGDCVEDGSVDVAHTETTATVAKGSVIHKDGGDDSCPVAFTVTRTRTGTLDPAFGGGTITHSFSSTVHLTSNP